MNTDKHPSEEWQKELEETPLLRSLRRETPFRPPEGYFDRLHAELEQTAEDEQVLENAPLLASLPKCNLFQVPGDYFNHLPLRISALLELIPSREVNQQRALWRMSPRYSLAIAAAIALLVVIGIWLRPTSDPLQLDELSTEDLVAVIEWEGVPAETIVEVLGEEHLLTVESESEEAVSEDELSEQLQHLEEGELEDMLLDI